MHRCKGSQDFRQRLVLTTLSGKPIRIDEIRASDLNPGLRNYEVCFLRLLEKLSNGCIVEINETGTSMRYRPGIVTGGLGIVHDCGTARALGYYIEPLVSLAMFGKKPLSIQLHGITNDDVDPCVDVLRTVTWPLLRELSGEEDGWEFKVVKRGSQPEGGGQVHLRIPVVRTLPPVKLLDEGMVKRIRGVAYSMRMPPQSSSRVVDGVRGMLNDLLADVYVFTDHMTGPAAGHSPGYGVALVAETTSGRFLSSQASSAHAQRLSQATPVGAAPSGMDDAVVPEDVGRAAAAKLLEEVQRGGTVDSMHQALVLLLCALGPDELNQVRYGPLTPQAIQMLRLIKDFLGVVFAIRPERATKTVFLSCVGTGARNIAKRVG